MRPVTGVVPGAQARSCQGLLLCAVPTPRLYQAGFEGLPTTPSPSLPWQMGADRQGENCSAQVSSEIL